MLQKHLHHLSLTSVSTKFDFNSWKHFFFHHKVVAYAHDVQGLVEAPIQAIYTLTLISLGFLVRIFYLNNLLDYTIFKIILYYLN